VVLNAAALVLSWMLAAPQVGSPENLLINPDASQDTKGWQLYMGASLASCEERNRCFVVKERAGFVQKFPLPDNSAGQFVLMIGFAKAERVDPNAGITDRPVLHVTFENADASRILYTKRMVGNAVHTAESPSEWQRIWSAYQIPDGATAGSLRLGLGSRQGIPHDGSAGRFDDLGVFIFRSEADARAFVTGYSRR
jgi:hypothetical protein